MSFYIMVPHARYQGPNGEDWSVTGPPPGFKKDACLAKTPWHLLSKRDGRGVQAPCLGWFNFCMALPDTMWVPPGYRTVMPPVWVAFVAFRLNTHCPGCGQPILRADGRRTGGAPKGCEADHKVRVHMATSRPKKPLPTPQAHHPPPIPTQNGNSRDGHMSNWQFLHTQCHCAKTEVERMFFMAKKILPEDLWIELVVKCGDNHFITANTEAVCRAITTAAPLTPGHQLLQRPMQKPGGGR